MYFQYFYDCVANNLCNKLYFWMEQLLLITPKGILIKTPLIPFEYDIDF